MLFSAALFAAAADAVTRGRVRARCRSPLLSSRSVVINPFLSFDLIPWVGHLNPPCAHHTLVRGFRFDAARMALGWRHHTLIQALLSRGPMTEESFYPLFAGISGKNPATHRQVFNETLLKINKALAYVQFELRACCNQYDGKVYYSVVNNVVDEQSKLGSKYSYVVEDMFPLI